MDVSFINPFMRATLDTFKTMLNTDAKPGVPQLKKEKMPTYDVSGIIGLSGDAKGSITISFPKIMALKVVSVMIGVKLKVIGPELTDGIGEIANIIAGNAKQHLNGLNLSISLPNVVVGKEHTLVTQKDVPTLVIPYTTEMGNFSIEVTLKTK